MNKLSPPVIYYHSVAPALFDRWVQKFLTLPLETFEDQLDYLRANHFRALFFDEWLLYRNGEARVSGKEVCIAFDDGLLDNWVYAYPLAKKYGMRFTLFISPECVDPRPVVRPTLEDVWNGRCRASELQALGYLSWNIPFPTNSAASTTAVSPACTPS
ncbi:MAG: polysaccharide deacetylase family protein [Thermoanaerobaculia bacterium]|nr:polysaccharide deacetylase family protein [Thermoanaerobaculia bacterium]